MRRLDKPLPRIDSLLMFDVLGLALSKSPEDISGSFSDGRYERSEVLRCLVVLWRARTIHAPEVGSGLSGRRSITLRKGITRSGRILHRILQELLFISPMTHSFMGIYTEFDKVCDI